MSDESVAAFAATYPFALDDFQRDAIETLAGGVSVMVAAPTGTGKTVVAEYAVYRARERGRRAFYTTPIKALSNQKYRDFRARYGDAVGLMTGDIVENPSGQILVMTTEVVRNMLIQRPAAFSDVDCVIFDEVHYLSDPARGTTWEEAIICAPTTAQLVCLSATVSNAGQVADWISEVHRPIRLITHRQRAVPLEHFYYLDGELVPLIDAHGKASRSLRGIGGERHRGIRVRGGEWPRERRGPSRPESSPNDIIARLRVDELLPAIYFFFSRRDCEEAAEAAGRIGLTTSEAAASIRAHITARLANLEPADRELGQVRLLERLLPRGVGFHHAGLLPILKVIVEELFNQGLLQVVFATDTLSLGINMPARAVIIGELTKFDGESRRPLTPNEYRQMTGRAGRRGIDAHGTAIVPYSPWVPVEDVIAIGTGDLLPIESSFSARYNTVLNLWDAGPNPTERLSRLFAHSLREFQLDGEVKAIQDEVHGIQNELRTLPREELNQPAHGRDARRLRGARYAGQYTHRDLLTDLLAEVEQRLLRARQGKRVRARRLLRSLEQTLEILGYLIDGRPAPKAAALREMFDANGLILVEGLASGVFDRAGSADIIEAVSWFCFDRDKAFYNRFRIPHDAWLIRERLERIQDRVLRTENDSALSLTPGFSSSFSGIAHAWCSGVSFDEILNGTSLSEGDVMMTFAKILDLARQLRAAAQALGPSHPALPSLAAGEGMTRRGIVALCCGLGIANGGGPAAC
ncbi:MAG: DEAD/DEAH box helicase [Chloroflexota bacterium]|nr:MAG: DEAD/DEAH box helicase [Chloroflexota bacterium]